MRKIMLIAALIGFAGMAYADGQPQVPQQPPPAAPGPVAQPRPVFVPDGRIQFRYASMRMQQGDCLIQIAFTVDNRLIQVMGRAATGNGRGELFEPNRFSPVPDNQYSMGHFILVGNVDYGAVLVEVRNPVTGEGLLAIFEMTNNRTGLELASHKWMFTDGFALATFDQDLRTAGLISDNLAMRFEQASSAAEFLVRLARRKGPPDINARPTCEGPCGGRGYQPIGGPIGPVGVVNPLAVPGGIVDPSLVGGPAGYGPRY